MEGEAAGNIFVFSAEKSEKDSEKEMHNEREKSRGEREPGDAYGPATPSPEDSVGSIDVPRSVGSIW